MLPSGQQLLNRQTGRCTSNEDLSKSLQTLVRHVEDQSSWAACPLPPVRRDCNKSEQDQRSQTRADIIATRDRHLGSVFSDCAIETNLNCLSEASCSTNCKIAGRAIKLDFDGIDQAKFKAPSFRQRKLVCPDRVQTDAEAMTLNSDSEE